MFQTLAAAAVLALSATTASAFVLNAGNTLSNGGAYDVYGGPYAFNVSFFDAVDPSGAFTFTFTNSDSIDAILNVSSAVTQVGYDFAGGVTMALSGGPSITFAQGQTSGDMLSYRLAAGDSTTLSITYGDTILGAPPRVLAMITVGVEASAVPVPAAGGLLLAAIGGLALMRRRMA